MSPKSVIWNFFTKIDKDSASCNFCKAVCGGKQGATSGYRRHLKLHPTEMDKMEKAEKERNDASTSAPTAKRPRDQPTLQEFQSHFTTYGGNSSQQQQFDANFVL